MRLFIRYCAVLAVTVYVGHAVLPRVVPAGWEPDMTAATIVYVALAVGGVRALLTGFILGLVADLFGWGPVGVGALAGTATAAACGLLHGQIYENSIAAPAAVAALAALVKGALMLAVAAAFAGLLGGGWALVGRLAACALATGVVAAPLYFLFWRIIPPPTK